MEENSLIYQQVINNKFFHDFIVFLKYLEQKPIKRTVTGNISLIDIFSLQKQFHQQEVFDKFKKYNWEIRSERQLEFLTKIKIIAETIMNALNNEIANYKTAVGIGGPHYCSNFNKIMLRTDTAVSHICPKYHLQDLNENLVKQSIEKTIEKVDFILLDWKGLGKEKQRIVDLLKNFDIEVKRIEQILDRKV